MSKDAPRVLSTTCTPRTIPPTTPHHRPLCFLAKVDGKTSAIKTVKGTRLLSLNSDRNASQSGGDGVEDGVVLADGDPAGMPAEEGAERHSPPRAGPGREHGSATSAEEGAASHTITMSLSSHR